MAVLKVRDLAYVRFSAPDLDEMQRFGAHFGLPVDPLDGPGGGRVVKPIDLDGFGVEVIAAFRPAASLPLPDRLEGKDRVLR